MIIKIHCEHCDKYYAQEVLVDSMRMIITTIDRSVCPFCLNARNPVLYERLAKRNPKLIYCSKCKRILGNKGSQCNSYLRLCHSCYMIEWRKKTKESRKNKV